MALFVRALRPVPKAEAPRGHQAALQRKCSACAEDERLHRQAAQPSAKDFSRLAVSQPGDPAEKDADQMADRVMRMDAATASPPAAERAQLPAGPVPPHLLPAAGRPLDGAARSAMESSFGFSFSRVRIHDDAEAADSARAIHAHAYTVGPDIFFDHGRFDFGTPSGRRLLAHELAHVVQQSRAGFSLQRQDADHTQDSDHTQDRSVQTQRHLLPGPLPSPQAPSPLGLSNELQFRPPDLKVAPPCTSGQFHDPDLRMTFDYVVHFGEVRVGGDLAWRHNNRGNIRYRTEGQAVAAGAACLDRTCVQNAHARGRRRNCWAIFLDENNRAAIEHAVAAHSMSGESPHRRPNTVFEVLAGYVGSPKHPPDNDYVSRALRELNAIHHPPGGWLRTTPLSGNPAERAAEVQAIARGIRSAEGWTRGRVYRCGSPGIPEFCRHLLGCPPPVSGNEPHLLPPGELRLAGPS